MDKLIGPVLLGMTASYFIFGLTTQQTFMYFHHFPEDEKWMKCSVALIWTLDASLLLPQMYAVYQMLAVHFGDIVGLELWLGWPMIVLNSIAVVIILFVQLLYTYRLWRLGSGKGYLCYIIVAWLLVFCGVAIVMIHDISRMGSMKATWSGKGGLIMAMITDIVITVAMCYHLQKSKSKFTDSRHNTRVSKIMQYTVGSGMLTSTFALASLIVYVISPQNLTFFGILCPYISLYGVSYLTLLNARDDRRREDMERGCQVQRMCTPIVLPSSALALNSPIRS